MDENGIYKTLDGDTFNGAVKLGFAEAGSEEWHEMRRHGVGGSEIGTIMGLNPWESAFALWAKRTGQIPDPPLSSWSIRFGRAFEKPVLSLWAEEHPEFEVYEAGTYRHPDYDFLHANPDALAYDAKNDEWIVVEVKTSRGTWGDAPPAYVAQVQHYMAVFGLKRSVIVAVAGWNYEERWIDRDDFQVGAQIESAIRFWDHLQNLQKPDWDGSKATYEAVRYLNPHIEADEQVDLGDVGELLLRAHGGFLQSEQLLNETKSKVLNSMGKAKYGFVMRNGEKVIVAQRQSRAQGKPWLVVKGER